MTINSYLQTEICQIKTDYEKSGSDKSLDEYALEWIEENGERFSHEYDNDGK